MGKLLFNVVTITGILLVFSNVSLKVNGEGVALFIFGDSTVDSGNNNYIDTIPREQANFEPYGLNDFFQFPTGRFSDGRIIVDFIAEYAKLPLIPPFLQPSIEYVNGVNFASGGGGVLSETNQGLVIDLKTQLKHFKEVGKSFRKKLGDEEANKLISDAVYFISVGTNDYLVNLGTPEKQVLNQPQEFVKMVIGNLSAAIQELYTLGGRKFGFLNLGPLGCIPGIRAKNPKNNSGGCFEDVNYLSLRHNHALDSLLNDLNCELPGFKYSNVGFYNWLLDRVENPSIYGFKEGVDACCGIGEYRGIFSCGGKREVKEYKLCENRDEFVWWDSYHPSEKLHQQLAFTVWNGLSGFVAPFPLHHFFNISSNIIAPLLHNPLHPQFF
jgi:hypothetical protein